MHAIIDNDVSLEHSQLLWQIEQSYPERDLTKKNGFGTGNV